MGAYHLLSCSATAWWCFQSPSRKPWIQISLQSHFRLKAGKALEQYITAEIYKTGGRRGGGGMDGELRMIYSDREGSPWISSCSITSTTNWIKLLYLQKKEQNFFKCSTSSKVQAFDTQNLFFSQSKGAPSYITGVSWSSPPPPPSTVGNNFSPQLEIGDNVHAQFFLFPICLEKLLRQAGLSFRFFPSKAYNLAFVHSRLF